MKKLNRIFREVRNVVSIRFPHLADTSLVVGCSLAEKEHRESPRQYMHVHHYPGAVCCATAAERLPIKNLRGLFLHEFGHLISPGDECDADLAILDHFDVEIRYKGKKELQEI